MHTHTRLSSVLLFNVVTIASLPAWSISGAAHHLEHKAKKTAKHTASKVKHAAHKTEQKAKQTLQNADNATNFHVPVESIAPIHFTITIINRTGDDLYWDIWGIRKWTNTLVNYSNFPKLAKHPIHGFLKTHRPGLFIPRYQQPSPSGRLKNGHKASTTWVYYQQNVTLDAADKSYRITTKCDRIGEIWLSTQNRNNPQAQKIRYVFGNMVSNGASIATGSKKQWNNAVIASDLSIEVRKDSKGLFVAHHVLETKPHFPTLKITSRTHAHNFCGPTIQSGTYGDHIKHIYHDAPQPHFKTATQKRNYYKTHAKSGSITQCINGACYPRK